MERLRRLTHEVTYFYDDMKMILESGKVADVQQRHNAREECFAVSENQPDPISLTAATSLSTSSMVV